MTELGQGVGVRAHYPIEDVSFGPHLWSKSYLKEKIRNVDHTTQQVSLKTE